MTPGHVDLEPTWLLPFVLGLLALAPLACVADAPLKVDTAAVLPGPAVDYRLDAVDIGLHVGLSADWSKSSTTTTAQSRLDTSNSTYKFTRTETRTIKQSVAQNIGSTFDTADKGGVIKITGGMSASSSDATELALSTQDELSRKSDYSRKVDTFFQEKATITKTLDKDSGYVHTGITFINNTGQDLELRNISFAIVLSDPCGALPPQSFYTTAPYLTNDMLTPAVPNAKDQANNASSTSAIIPLSHSGTSAVAIYLKLLPTDSLVETIASRLLPTLHVTGYSAYENGKLVYQMETHDQLVKRGIGIRVTEAEGNDRQFYVAIPAGKSMSLADALQLIGASPELRTLNGSDRILSLFGVPSDLRMFDKLVNVPEDKTGAWFAASSSESFRGGLSSPAPVGTEFVVAYLSPSDVQRGQISVTRREKIAIPRPLAPNDDKSVVEQVQSRWGIRGEPTLYPAALLGKVSLGDVVDLTITAKKRIPEHAPHLYADYLPPDQRLAYQVTRATDWVLSSREEPITAWDASAKGLNLSVSFDITNRQKQLIGLDKLVLACPSRPVVYPDGRMEIAFIVTPEMLTDEKALLYLVAPPVEVSAGPTPQMPDAKDERPIIGRTYVPANENEGGFIGAIHQGYNNMAKRWVAGDPAHPSDAQELRLLEVSAVLKRHWNQTD